MYNKFFLQKVPKIEYSSPFVRPVEGKNTASLSIAKVLTLKATVVYMPTYVSTVLVNIPDSTTQSVGKDNTVKQKQNRPTMTFLHSSLEFWCTFWIYGPFQERWLENPISVRECFPLRLQWTCGAKSCQTHQLYYIQIISRPSH